jgi:acyl transferase domain-containing protein
MRDGIDECAVALRRRSGADLRRAILEARPGEVGSPEAVFAVQFATTKLLIRLGASLRVFGAEGNGAVLAPAIAGEISLEEAFGFLANGDDNLRRDGKVLLVSARDREPESRKLMSLVLGESVQGARPASRESEGAWDCAGFLRIVGQLYCAGATLDWDELHGPGARVRLPTYPYQRRSIWFERDVGPADLRAHSTA